MSSSSTLKISTRILMLIAAALLGLLVMAGYALNNLKSSLMAEKEAKTRNLVEAAAGVLNYHQKLAQEGKLAPEAAQAAARESLRALRYDGTDYFFIYDTAYKTVLAPTHPDDEGKDAKEAKDARGFAYARTIVDKGVQGGGFVEYWFPKPGEKEAQPKISYAMQFEPWKWVLGTGIYIDDVNREFMAQALWLGGIALVLLAILAVIGWRVRATILGQLGGEPADAVVIMKKVADGDLTTRIDNAPAGSLLHSLAGMVAALKDSMHQIDGQAQNVVQHAEEISVASAEVAKAALQQSEATSSMAAGIEELTVSSNYISDNAKQTEGYSHEAVQIAAQGTERVHRTKTAIERVAATVTETAERIRALEERAEQVSSITGVIKEIAGQTNLLALNAAIEAARAGETGRGFAVVADEVRKLAERTAAATTEIEQMLSGIQLDTANAVQAMNSALPEVAEGVALSAAVAESLQTIEAGANQALGRISDVANSTKEQSVASTSIAQRVEQIAQMVEETSGTMNNTALTAKNLEEVATSLQRVVSRFRLS